MPFEARAVESSCCWAREETAAATFPLALSSGNNFPLGNPHWRRVGDFLRRYICTYKKHKKRPLSMLLKVGVGGGGQKLQLLLDQGSFRDLRLKRHWGIERGADAFPRARASPTLTCRALYICSSWRPCANWQEAPLHKNYISSSQTQSQATYHSGLD